MTNRTSQDVGVKLFHQSAAWDCLCSCSFYKSTVILKICYSEHCFDKAWISSRCTHQLPITYSICHMCIPNKWVCRRSASEVNAVCCNCNLITVNNQIRVIIWLQCLICTVWFTVATWHEMICLIILFMTREMKERKKENSETVFISANSLTCRVGCNLKPSEPLHSLCIENLLGLSLLYDFSGTLVSKTAN